MRTQISELDAHILALEASLAAARRERENLQSQLDDYRYPVLSLPPEITSEIFINFLPIYPLRSPLTGLLSPALLGQICRQWRDIAFSIPRLWRAIEIYLQRTSSLDAQLNVLTTWLSRSKNYPLSLSFEMELIFLQLPHFTAALISQSERWEYVRLITPFDDLRWLDRPFPLLRDLTFGPAYYSATEGAIIAFRNASQLKRVVLCVMFNPSRVVLPWSQLTSINAEEMELAKAADILRQATALVSFRCAIWDPGAVPRAVPPLVHLRSLILRDNKNIHGPQKRLLDALTAPTLRHLTISEHELGYDPISTIVAFLSRSRCSLDSLHITHSALPFDYRAAFPSIKVIKVFNYAKIYSDDDTGVEDGGSDDGGD
jgi:hypothetical protein